MRKNIVDEQTKETYSYGFQLLISTICNIILILIVAFCLGILSESLFFIVSFVIMRSVGGGYHADTHKGCIILFCLVFVIFSLLSIYLFYRFASMYMIVGSIAAFFVIWEIAPVEAPNRRLSAAKTERLRNGSLLISSLFTAVAVLSNIVSFPFLKSEHMLFFFSGYLAAILSMATAAILRKHFIIKRQ
ncbi:MAG: accessory gene regulator B family protein [Clostridiales Family XIII bacterium]|nr:accessory gene regulator B family protein [Clostridiales Family XIII bacterium]